MRRDAKAIDSAEIYSSQVLHAEKRTPGKMIEEIKGEEGSSVEDARYQCKLKMNLTITKSGPR